MTKNLKILWFIIGSVVFLCIPIFSSPDFGEYHSLFSIPMFLRMFTSYIGVLLFFFINYFILIPRFYFKKKYFLFAFSILAIFLIVDNVPKMIFEPGKPSNKLKIEDMKPFEIQKNNGPRTTPYLPENIFFQFFLIVFVSLLLRVNMRLKETENAKLQSEIAYLKAQINPHFLFNTLNSLYALTLEKSDEAPGAVVKLSKLMRYIISESSKDFVSLDHELEYVRNFVGLQKLRLTSKTLMNFEIINQDKNKLQIAPLLLISFVENAFKYGVNPDMESFIGILINIEQGLLEMIIINSKVADADEQEKNGVGISNSRKRLEMLYPHKHQLNISETSTEYKVKLKINLNAESNSHR